MKILLNKKFLLALLILIAATYYYFDYRSDVSTEYQGDPNEDQSAVVSAIKSHALAKYGEEASFLSVDFVNAGTARGNIAIGDVQTGFKWFAAIINNKWTVVWEGNGIPTCSEVAQFNLSKDFLYCTD